MQVLRYGGLPSLRVPREGRALKVAAMQVAALLRPMVTALLTGGIRRPIAIREAIGGGLRGGKRPSGVSGEDGNGERVMQGES